MAHRPWTSADDATLRKRWGIPVPEMATLLGRTAHSVVWRAKMHKLPFGLQPGHEALTHAAKRSGFCVRRLRVILNAAKVEIHPWVSRPNGSKRCRAYVDAFDVDQAVAKWAGTETVQAAALARGLRHDTLRKALKRAGQHPPAKRHMWRLPSEKIDAVVANWPKGKRPGPKRKRRRSR